MPIHVPFVGETVLVTERSMTGATGNHYCGLHEFSDMSFLLHFLRSDDLFLDIGANVGSYTILASGVVGAKSISVEPVPSTFKFLERNISCNNLHDHVRPIRCAVGRANGTIRFSADRDTTNQFVNDDYSGTTIEVEVKTIDDILAGQVCSLWKVDVEGFEREVLAGAVHSLKSEGLQAVLLEADDSEIRNVMQSAGFTAVRYDVQNRGILGELDSASGPKCGNNLWIKDVEFVQKRCKDAPRQEIQGVNI